MAPHAQSRDADREIVELRLLIRGDQILVPRGPQLLMHRVRKVMHEKLAPREVEPIARFSKRLPARVLLYERRELCFVIRVEPVLRIADEEQLFEHRLVIIKHLAHVNALHKLL